MSLEYFILGQKFINDSGRLGDLNDQLAEYELIAEIEEGHSANDKPNYFVRRITDQQGKKRYDLVHYHSKCRNFGRNSLTKVLIGKRIRNDSVAEGYGFYTKQIPAVELLKSLSEVMEDLKDIGLTHVEEP